jgi:plastocyanin
MSALLHGTSLAALASFCLVAATAQAYEEVAVSNGGTIRGKVAYQGAVPVKKVIPTKDQEVCGSPRDEPQILVGPDKGVQDAVVYLRDVPKGKPWGPAERAPVLDNKACRFEPPVQIMRAGAIDIHNSDPVLHNTHGFYGRRTAFNVALPNAGASVTSQLPRPGMVRVECDAHGWMLAHVFVADSPYYALTGKDGTFAITGVPPGRYTLVASQHYAGETETAVTVAGGDTQDLSIELKPR